MTAPQEGQRELGRTIDCSRGSRWITTFRKLPIIAPKTLATTYMNGSGIKLKSGRTAVRERCIDRHCIVFQARCGGDLKSEFGVQTFDCRSPGSNLKGVLLKAPRSPLP